MHTCQWIVVLGVVGVGACRPSDVLSVPGPAGALTSSTVHSQAGAESALDGARAQLFLAVDGNFQGLLTWSELLTDEFTFSGFTIFGSFANVDARMTAGGRRFQESVDSPWEYLLRARSSLLAAVPALTAYEPPNARSKIGEAYALAGYAELLVAESYCAGTPLDDVLPDRIQYGVPLTTDSLLGVAEAHFDSASAEAHGNATVSELAAVGLGRVLLDRGQYQAAATAVSSVATGFVYNAELEPNTSAGAAQPPNLYAYGIQLGFERFFNVADREGQNGLNFVSANDPRLVLDTVTYTTTDETAPWRLPMKFETNPSLVPLATGIEARLIQAEAALKANNVNGWTTDLNALRTDAADTKVTFPPATQSLTADSTTLASPALQVDVMFRERAFWLFGTGTRLGDLRRLIRQYGRDQSTVFPSGPYANGNNPRLPSPIPSYGTDVSLTLPTAAGLSGLGQTITNPNYRGCTAPTTAG